MPSAEPRAVLSVVLSAAFRGVGLKRRRSGASAERVRLECKTAAQPSPRVCAKHGAEALRGSRGARVMAVGVLCWGRILATALQRGREGT